MIALVSQAKDPMCCSNLLVCQSQLYTQILEKWLLCSFIVTMDLIWTRNNWSQWCPWTLDTNVNSGLVYNSPLNVWVFPFLPDSVTQINSCRFTWRKDQSGRYHIYFITIYTQGYRVLPPNNKHPLLSIASGSENWFRPWNWASYWDFFLRVNMLTLLFFHSCLFPVVDINQHSCWLPVLYQPTP